MDDILFSNIKELLRLKDLASSALSRLGLLTLRDLLFYRPNSYQIKIANPNLSKLQDGMWIQANVIVEDILLPQKRHLPTKIMVGNDSGSILLVFFNKIPPFIFNRLKINSKHTISGKVQFFDYYFQISHPEFLRINPSSETKSELEPIYPLTYGITNRQLYNYVLQGLELLKKSCYSNQLLRNLEKLHYKNFGSALSKKSVEIEYEATLRKLAKEELFANQAFLKFARGQKYLGLGRIFVKDHDIQNKILQTLNFQLTPSQETAIEQIEQDQQKNIQMTRLLQGDVGSGKTLVALLTMVNVLHIAQAAIMAPTDLLANQHYQFFVKALQDTDIQIALLTGKTSSSAKKNILQNLEDGRVQILIGTHAIFQDKVNFKDLGYIVIDEQHRFGVEQRLSLINKASHPDILVMTATPIPRSLALTMFGDMDITLLNGKPKNRLPIITKVVPIEKLDNILSSIAKKIENGDKIYWVCPLISNEENEEETIIDSVEFDYNQIIDVNTRFAALSALYPNKVQMMHGKIPPQQKEEMMTRFKSGAIQILVSTTVIEVGIDVPDATLIIIENAEKFGLAQLHQLRGRVGRGKLQSYCILLYNPKRLSNYAKKRLETIRESEDGFFIAEQDLLLRGSGEILGLKQSGEPEFFFANLTRDFDLLTEANKLVQNVEFNDLLESQVRLFSKNTKQCVVKSG